MDGISRSIHRRISALTMGAWLLTVGCGSADGQASATVADDLLADEAGAATTVAASGLAATEPTSQEPSTDEADNALPPSTTPDAVADSADGSQRAAVPTIDPDRVEATTAEKSTTAVGPAAGAVAPPGWIGKRTLTTDQDGTVVPQTTPPELVHRRFTTTDLLPPPAGGAFTSSVEVLAGEPLARSTWVEGCPVPAAELRYVTVSFWGFDGRPHQGELILHGDVAEAIVTVFADLYEARFPIEEMRIVTTADLDAEPTGDTNNTASFVCRQVVGGSRFSEHAHGLAIDLNPFQNPYVKGELVLPELAGAYLDRDRFRAGMVVEGDMVIAAFARAGWGWGGRWNSLKDYQHFALHDR